MGILTTPEAKQHVHKLRHWACEERLMYWQMMRPLQHHKFQHARTRVSLGAAERPRFRPRSVCKGISTASGLPMLFSLLGDAHDLQMTSHHRHVCLGMGSARVVWGRMCMGASASADAHAGGHSARPLS